MCQILLLMWYATMRHNAVNAGNQNYACLKSVHSCRQPLSTAELCSELPCWTRRAATAERWALQLPLEGPRVWLIFWLFTIMICSEMLNFNVTPFLILYNSTSFQCEAFEDLMAALFKAFIARSQHWVQDCKLIFLGRMVAVACTAIVQQLPALFWVSQNLKELQFQLGAEFTLDFTWNSCKTFNVWLLFHLKWVESISGKHINLLIFHM